MLRTATIVLALVVALTTVVWLAPVAAQEETPTPAAGDDQLIPRIISPEGCLVEPRDKDGLLALLGLAGSSAPPIERIPVQLPFIGEQIDAATEDAIVAVVKEWFACLNANDKLRIAALMTDAGAQSYFGSYERTPEEVQTAIDYLSAAPVPRIPPADSEAAPEDVYIRLIAVTDAAFLEDGRVAAFVVMNEPLTLPRGPETLLVIFAFDPDQGRWLIDGFFDFSDITPLPEETPAPAEG